MQRLAVNSTRDSETTTVIRKQHGLFLSATVLTIMLFAGFYAARGQETQDSYKLGRDAQQGKQINPVPLNLQGKNPETVYLGSYLVNAQGGCNSCHTCPSYKGTDPYQTGGPNLGPTANPGPVNVARFLAGGTPFSQRVGATLKGLNIISSNLSPDSAGLPGGLAFNDFKNAMQNGQVSTKPGRTLQVHPWPVYRKLYDNDLFAIYEYLRSIPAAKAGACSDSDQTEN